MVRAVKYLLKVNLLPSRMKQVCFELTLQGQFRICSFIKMMLKGEAFRTEITKLILEIELCTTLWCARRDKGLLVVATHSGIWEEPILVTVGRPVSRDAGIRGKPLGGRPPNTLSLVITCGIS